MTDSTSVTGRGGEPRIVTVHSVDVGIGYVAKIKDTGGRLLATSGQYSSRRSALNAGVTLAKRR